MPFPSFPGKGSNSAVRQCGLGARRVALQGERGNRSGSSHLSGGPDNVKKIGIITGGAGSEIGAIAETGVDTFITGEGPHWSYTSAEELGINLVYGGHYATETFGVKALASKWCEEFTDVEWEFYDHPTGL